MSELLLDSLEVKGYRCFEHLTIEKLGRVNLIVSKNNVGKTALLEALWIYSTNGVMQALTQVLSSRNEIPLIEESPSVVVNKDNVWSIKNLFTDRPKVEGESLEYVNIGSLNENKPNLSIGVMYFGKDEKDEGHFFDRITDVDIAEPFLCSQVKNNGRNRVTEMFSLEKIRSFPLEEERTPIKSLPIRSDGIDNLGLARLWDGISLTDLESKVSSALKLISPEIEKVGFIGNPQGSPERIPIVRLSNSETPIALRSLGEGMNRLLGIALALVNCKDGMLLIDEIENGLHYTVLPDVWRLIFKTARELNVQVFATTHSSDCIYAFQKAAEEDKESDGMLIRLVRKNDKIKAITFDEEEMETVARQQIEVR
jgi:hypothetical protein